MALLLIGCHIGTQQKGAVVFATAPGSKKRASFIWPHSLAVWCQRTCPRCDSESDVNLIRWTVGQRPSCGPSELAGKARVFLWGSEVSEPNPGAAAGSLAVWGGRLGGAVVPDARRSGWGGG